MSQEIPVEFGLLACTLDVESDLPANTRRHRRHLGHCTATVHEAPACGVGAVRLTVQWQGRMGQRTREIAAPRREGP
jgi:hypothetical protein